MLLVEILRFSLFLQSVYFILKMYVCILYKKGKIMNKRITLYYMSPKKAIFIPLYCVIALLMLSISHLNALSVGDIEKMPQDKLFKNLTLQVRKALGVVGTKPEDVEKWEKVTIAANEFVLKKIDQRRAPKYYKEFINDMNKYFFAFIMIIKQIEAKNKLDVKTQQANIRKAIENLKKNILYAALNNLHKNIPAPPSWLRHITKNGKLIDTEKVFPKYKNFFKEYEGRKILITPNNLDALIDLLRNRGIIDESSPTTKIMSIIAFTNLLDQIIYIQKQKIKTTKKRKDITRRGNIIRNARDIKTLLMGYYLTKIGLLTKLDEAKLGLTQIDANKMGIEGDKASTIIVAQAVGYILAFYQLIAFLRTYKPITPGIASTRSG